MEGFELKYGTKVSASRYLAAGKASFAWGKVSRKFALAKATAANTIPMESTYLKHLAFLHGDILERGLSVRWSKAMVLYHLYKNNIIMSSRLPARRSP